MTRKNSQLHSNKGRKSVSKDKAQSYAQQNKDKGSESHDITAMYISSNSA
jgi:hypothetical protein